MLNKQQIMSSINLLNEAERAEVVDWCLSLGVALPRGDEYTEHAYDELSCRLAEFYRDTAVSFSAFIHKNRHSFKLLRVAVEQARKRIDDWWPTATRTTKLGLLRYLCRVSFDTCIQRSPRVDWRHLAGALGNTEATVNDAFPGWLNSGEFQRRAIQRVAPSSRRRSVPSATAVVH